MAVLLIVENTVYSGRVLSCPQRYAGSRTIRRFTSENFAYFV